jgi:hypothetical protein
VLSSLRRTLTVSMKILNSDCEFRPTIIARVRRIVVPGDLYSFLAAARNKIAPQHGARS